MLKASKQQQTLLLDLFKKDLEITRLKTELQQIENSSDVEKLRQQILATSERLIASHANADNLRSQIDKHNSDLELVEARILQDEARAKSVSSEREQKAVAEELASLLGRKGELEDSELQLLGELEISEKELEELTQERTSLNLNLEELLSKQHAAALNLSANIQELSAKRETEHSGLDSELAVIYDRKSARGIAVAQTLGRDCSACRLAINAVEFESMMNEPADHLPTCPNCDALIIR